MTDNRNSTSEQKSIRAAMALKDVLKIIKCLEQEATDLGRLLEEKKNGNV